MGTQKINTNKIVKDRSNYRGELIQHVQDVYNTNQGSNKAKNMPKRIESTSLYKIYRNKTTNKYSKNKSK